jgi:tetratricopeptide (TPR) repeat protein
MNAILKLYTLGAMVLMLTACASMDTHIDKYPAANDRLNYILGLYKINQKDGNACQEMWKANNPITDCDRLLVELERLVAEFPHHQRVLMANAVLQYNNGRPDKAQYLLDNLLGQSGSHPEAAILRARISLEQGNHIRATQALEREIILAPFHPGLRSALAAVFYADGDYAKARGVMRSAIGETNLNPWRTAYHHGLLAEGEKDWQGACLLYRLALDQRPGYKPASARLIGISEHISCEIPESSRGTDASGGGVLAPLVE